ncbi:MAG TPA: Rieske 2Fe-2S domain-containing protein [Gemmatimonadaceae bacterium]|nr:Rieske 2Fe-2S domain-containing protein [Gemmatimonadaceae bacterium]
MSDSGICGARGDGTAQDVAEGRGAGAELEHLADVDEVPEGTLLGVRNAAGEEICLFNHRGTIGAVGDICTHAEFLMSDGLLRGDGTIECAWHGARFQCRSGAVCRGPAVDPLPVYEVRVEDGRVLVGRRRNA